MPLGEFVKDYKTKMPDPHKKNWILGGFGAALGGGIGGYLSAVHGNNLYAGMGAGIGAIVGVLIGLLIGQKVTLPALISSEKVMNCVLGTASILMAIAGIVGFILTRKWIGIIGTLFFGACGFYLFRKRS